MATWGEMPSRVKFWARGGYRRSSGNGDSLREKSRDSLAKWENVRGNRSEIESSIKEARKVKTLTHEQVLFHLQQCQ